MSRSNAPLQATIDKWVNAEAVMVWADRLDNWATQCVSTPLDDDAIEQRERQAAKELREAAILLRLAAAQANKAVMDAQRLSYDRLRKSA